MKIKIKKKTQKKRIFYLHYYFTRIKISQVSKICSFWQCIKVTTSVLQKQQNPKKKTKATKIQKKKTIKNLIAVLVKQFIF